MSLGKAKEICKTLVDVYRNNTVDIQGGEPTLWKDIFALVRYCREIGLDPTIITNAQVLEDKRTVSQYKEAGIRDFMVSVQGLGPVYDRIVQIRGAHRRQMKALRNLQEVGIPFRFNCVISKASVMQLPQIAELGILTGAQSVDFLNFNPLLDQRIDGMRTRENVPTYSEAAEFLNKALDKLAEAGIEGNVRQFPICMVAERHRKSVYTISQMPHDLHEYNFASLDWTSRAPQRMREGELSPPPEFGPSIKWGPLRALRSFGQIPYFGPGLLAIKRRMDRAWARGWIKIAGNSMESKYRADGQRKAQEQVRQACGYQHVTACSLCDTRMICDGYHSDYGALFGTHEAKPIQIGYAIEDPKHYIRDQLKKVHPYDMTWLTE
jgi:hypothetical protein